MGGWTSPELVWTFSGRQKYLVSVGNGSLDHPAHSLVTTEVQFNTVDHFCSWFGKLYLYFHCHINNNVQVSVCQFWTSLTKEVSIPNMSNSLELMCCLRSPLNDFIISVARVSVSILVNQNYYMDFNKI